MNPSAQREETLFEAARKLTDPDAREAFLRAACGNDLALRRRLDQLFAAQTDAEQFFIDDAATDTLIQTVTEGPGTIIGRYKLLQKIGEGGMGVVYMAEQTSPVTRKVALKIIKLGMDTRQVVARFEAERQALAM